jgi:hypothetical protein
MDNPPAQGHSSRIRGWEEPLIVWGIYALVGLGIFITYARLPASDFYHVSGDGIAAGASRTLVYLNFPVAFAAIALLGFAMASLLAPHASTTGGKRRLVGGIGIISLLLCLIAALPGVVDQDDLDARPINALPAVGVALVLILTIVAIRQGGPFTTIPWGRCDTIAAVVIAIMLILALPWILADAGIYIGDLPGMKGVFLSKEFEPEGATLRAVHLGHHHGLDGVIFIIASLLLGRKVGQIGPTLLQAIMRWYLAFMFAYGLFNSAQDFWLEQFVKRGWTDREIPSMLVPKLTPAWGLVILTMVAARFFIFQKHAEADTQGPTAEPRQSSEEPIAPLEARRNAS